jgi:hypothetical protein
MSLEARAEAARRRMQEGMGAVDEAAAIGQYMEQGRMSEVALGQQIGESVKQGGQVIGQALSGTGGAVPGTGQAGDTPDTPFTPFTPETPETPETPDTTAGMRVFKSPRYA